jgi:hypothetical protein
MGKIDTEKIASDEENIRWSFFMKMGCEAMYNKIVSDGNICKSFVYERRSWSDTVHAKLKTDYSPYELSLPLMLHVVKIYISFFHKKIRFPL